MHETDGGNRGSGFLERYEVGQLLGVGASARVCRGVQRSLGREVAIKIFHELPRSPGELRRIRSEAEALSRISHPGVVRVFELDQDETAMYLVMELIESQTLRAMLKGGWKPGVEEVLELGIALLEALSHVHGQGILHRDLKPENVFILHDFTPKIVDFGLAIVPGAGTAGTAAGAVVGTPIYLAPEILLGHEHGPLTDLYSVGLILRELLAGKTPFLGPMHELVKRKHRPLDPVSESVPGLDPRVGAVIDRAVKPDPRQRFASADELLEVLQETLEVALPPARPRTRTTKAGRPDPVPREDAARGRFSRRDVTVSLVSFLVGALTATALLAMLLVATRPPPSPPVVTASLPPSPPASPAGPAAPVTGGSRIYIENRTGDVVTVVTSPPVGLPEKAWRQLQRRIEPGDTTGYLWLDREWNVVSGKRFLVESKATWRGRSLTLRQELLGLDINSQMWHGLAAEPSVDTQVVLQYRWPLSDGRHILVEYQARPSRDPMGNDEVLYVFHAPSR